MSLDELIGARLRAAVKQEAGDGAKFGKRLSRFIGKEWGRQTVYEANEGRRKFRVSELVAFAQATHQPVHFFLDASSAGVQKVELVPGSEAIDGEELTNLFRIPEPRDMSRDVEVAVMLIQGAIKGLSAPARDLDHAARLINGTYWTDLKEGKLP